MAIGLQREQEMKRNNKQFRWLVAALFFASVGCGSSEDGTPLPDAQPTETTSPDADTSLVPDGTEPPPDGDALDTTTSEDVPLCDSDKACVGDRCTENADCDSGYCVPHLGDRVCTEACVSECLPGFS